MHSLNKLISSMYPSKNSIQFKGDVYQAQNLEPLLEKSLVSTFFMTAINARHYFMFSEGALDCEVIGGERPTLNWVSERRPPASTIAPIVLDIWRSDILPSMQLSGDTYNLTPAINSWAQAIKDVSGTVSYEPIAANMYTGELMHSDFQSKPDATFDLASVIYQVLQTRAQLEQPDAGNSSEQTPRMS